MKRRDFVASAFAAAGGIAAVSARAESASADAWTNVIFTKQQPGHWKDKEALHVPAVAISGSKVTVTTPHPMTEEHHIVSHTVVLAGGKFLSRKTFTWKDAPVSEHTLPEGYHGRLTVTSTCNQHDWWVAEANV